MLHQAHHDRDHHCRQDRDVLHQAHHDRDHFAHAADRFVRPSSVTLAAVFAHASKVVQFGFLSGVHVASKVVQLGSLLGAHVASKVVHLACLMAGRCYDFVPALLEARANFPLPAVVPSCVAQTLHFDVETRRGLLSVLHSGESEQNHAGYVRAFETFARIHVCSRHDDQPYSARLALFCCHSRDRCVVRVRDGVHQTPCLSECSHPVNDDQPIHGIALPLANFFHHVSVASVPCDWPHVLYRVLCCAPDCALCRAHGYSEFLDRAASS